jgi:tetratricopeptide (TPR) repeat protein
MSYRDFDIKLDKGEGFFIEVLDSPVGRRTRAQPLILPLEELPDWRACIKTRKKDREIYKRMGKTLFEALFPRSVLVIWSRCEQTLDLDSSSTLRLRLDIRCPELAEIPWEILYDGEGHYHLAQDERHPIVRYLVDSGDFHLLDRPTALNILIVAAAPKGWPNLPGLEVEMNDFREHLEKTAHVGTVQFLEGATLEKLNKELEKGYHILHYIGHAEFEAGRGSLILEDDKGEPDKVDADTLATYFRNTSLQLLVLNACETALMSAGDPVMGFANAAIIAGVPAVIAMQDNVFDQKAVAFSREFYRVLMDPKGYTLEKAMTKARQAVIRCASPDRPDWAIPVLFTNVQQGYLWGNPNAPETVRTLTVTRPLTLPTSATPAVDDVARGAEDTPSGESLDRVVSHNLTRTEYARFINREAELAMVLDGLTAENRLALISISGLGGVGKSALAREVADRLLELSKTDREDPRTFDAIIWISGWRASQPLQKLADQSQVTISTFDDVYQTIALVLRKPTMLKALPEERWPLLQNFLREGRYLLIIDDADEIRDDRFREFIEKLPAPTKAILTSRSPLKIEAVQVSLPGFSKQAALEYLYSEGQAMQITTLEKADQAELGKLIAESCGLPQVLNWVLEQLRDHRQSVSEVLKQLQQEVGDQSLADFCLRKSFEKLDDNQQRLLFTIALFAQPVLAEAAGRAADLTGEEFEEACARLLQLRLIQTDENGQRYGVMSFVRGYALKKLDHDLRLKRDLLLRALDYFREFAQANGEIGDWVAHDRFDTEMPNLVWATRQAYELGEWQRVLDFRAALCDFFNMRGYYSQAIEVGLLAFKAAENLENVAETGWCAIYPLGQSYFHQDMYDQAEEWCRKGLDAFERSGNERGQVHAQRYLGRIMQARGNYESAQSLFIDGFNLALRFDGSRKDFDRQGDLQASLAGLAEAQHNYESARRLYTEALGRYQKTGNMTGQAAMYHQLGTIALVQNDYDEAEKSFDDSLKALEGTKWLRRKAQVLYSSALLAEKRGDLARAHELLLDVHEKFKTLSAALELAHADAALARIQATQDYEQNERAVHAT